MASNNRMQRIRAINHRKDIDNLEKTRLIQQLFTPPKLVRQSSIGTEDVSSAFADSSNHGLRSIVHAPADKRDFLEYTACAVSIVPTPDWLEKDDFCIFSRKQMCEYDYVGTIVVSKTREGQLQWENVCNGKSQDDCEHSHFFSIEYLEMYVKDNGPEYIYCPLCRKGSKKRKAVEEEDLATMKDFEQNRQRFLQEQDHNMAMFEETKMIEKAAKDWWCPNQNLQHKKYNEERVKDIFKSWKKHRNFGDYSHILEDQVLVAIENKNKNILKIFAEHFKAMKGKNQDTWEKAFVFACKKNRVDCATFLIQQQAVVGQYMEAFEACVQQRNEEIFNLVVKRMQAQQSSELQTKFICPGQTFREIIRVDWRKAAECLFENRWKHSITIAEQDYAKNIDGNVYIWMKDTGRSQECRDYDLDDGDVNTPNLDKWPSTLSVGEDDSW